MSKTEYFLVLILLLKIVYSITIPMKDDIQNYGPYKIDMKNFSTCKGLRPANVTSYEIIPAMQSDGTRVIIFNFTVARPTTLDMLKITAFSTKDGKKTVLWNHNTKNPCQHFAFSVLIKQIRGISQSCHVKKGVYSVRLNMNFIIKSFLGASFFYGDYSFHVVTGAQQGNAICLNIHVVLYKPE